MNNYSTITQFNPTPNTVLPTSRNFGNLFGQLDIPSDEAAKLMERLKNFTTLAADWNGHGAKPMSFTAYKRAHAAILAFDRMSFLPAVVAPSADGGFDFLFSSSRAKISLHVDEDSWEWSVSPKSGGRSYHEEFCISAGASVACAQSLIQSASVTI